MNRWGFRGARRPPLRQARFGGRPGGPKERKPMASAMGKALKVIPSPGGAAEPTYWGWVMGRRMKVGPDPAFLIAPPGLGVSLGPCPHGSRRGLGISRPVRGWRIVRFMDSPLLEIDLLADHEPGWTPGGETPPSTAGETPAATDDRFRESVVAFDKPKSLLSGVDPVMAGSTPGEDARQYTVVDSTSAIGSCRARVVTWTSMRWSPADLPRPVTV